MVEVLCGGPWAYCDPVHLIMQAIEQEAQKLLSILLAGEDRVFLLVLAG